MKHLFLSLTVIAAMSCGKGQVIGEKRYEFDRYQMIIDKYTPDTIPIIRKDGSLDRTIWWKEDSVWRPEMKQMLDSTRDSWWYMCPTIEKPTGWLEHYYYLKNGQKIQPSTYPKN